MKNYQMYIDGQWCDASDGRSTEVINPATEEAFATVPMGTTEDTERAIKVAHHSFETGQWRYMDPAERSRILLDVLKKFKEKTINLFLFFRKKNG